MEIANAYLDSQVWVSLEEVWVKTSQSGDCYVDQVELWVAFRLRNVGHHDNALAGQLEEGAR